MIFKYISLPIFLVSLAFGIFFVYVYGDDMKPVYIYPTPENITEILYKDNADNCFTYEAVEVKCNKDAKTLPVQAEASAAAPI
jgi:hypothetical protein